MPTEARHRFDHDLHAYTTEHGEALPSITDMLERTGEIDDRFYTEEGRHRGTQAHRLTLDYDLGAIAVDDVVSKYRGFLLAWAKLTAVVRPDWRHLEEPFTHPTLRFAGTPDRVGTVLALLSVAEIKTGKYVRATRPGHPGPHELQTALQAILVASRLKLRPEVVARWGFYIQADGKFKVLEFKDHADLRRARAIIRECCAV